MKTPLALLIAAAATLGGFVMASGSAARADDLGYFQQQVDPYLQKPKFVAPGPAFDAQACMKGKTILSIPVSSANPFTANIEKAMVAVAKQVGVHLHRLAEPGAKLAMGAGHERRHQPEGQHDRSPGRH